jgi:RimJ/RimL family protein N-acetyltransferase
MILSKVVTPKLLSKCRRFLARDLTTNVLVLGNCYSPLLQVSMLFCAQEDNRILGVCSVFHGFSKPSIALAGTTAEIKGALLEKALEEVDDVFISICPKDVVKILKGTTIVLSVHDEQQMITNSSKAEENNIEVVRVTESEFEELNKFYLEHHAMAWIPLQFKVGPYYCVRQNGRIVSAAGVHICTPKIAHLGSIITDESYRNRGFGKACTSTLAHRLCKGRRIVSLYVMVDNKPAIQMYEKLGFKKIHEIAFITAQKIA